MNAKTYIFSGRSGCGKGTQVNLLVKTLQEKDPNRAIVHLETGNLFREFIKGNTYSQQMAKDILDKGGLQPEFLAIHLWSNFFIEQMNKDVHLIIDGTPRKAHEAIVLDSAIKFYERENPTFVFLNVSRDWSEKHLLSRKRADDTEEDIKARLDWYEAEVVPAVDYFRNNKDYKFIDIKGEQTIEEVHNDMIKVLEL